MTSITHPLAARHHIVGVVATAAATAGLTLGLTLAFWSSGSDRPAVHVSRADRTLCQDLANATAGSPAAFRLADEISSEGSC